MGTFRVAAQLCEEFDAFVFNHNEVILYEWVQEYEPSLFEHIKDLVKRGKWHIMGGWYLQPDCNMPSGESFARQALLGRQYFKKHFGVAPTVGINLDPFGHTRGLVQILSKSGYNAYLFCRPNQNDCPLPADQFIWEGYDGSRVFATRAQGHYNSPLGKAHEKVQGAIDNMGDNSVSIVLWGVGNHGGGPSRQDLRNLAQLIEETTDIQVAHSTPEAYFEKLAEKQDQLPVHSDDLNRWAVGCYTSQVRIKQEHRSLENDLYSAEKMASAAWVLGQMDYPADELAEAQRALAVSEFHDILPGSSIQPVENAALRSIAHGREILSRVKARAFFALAQGQSAAQEGEIPILVYNPHPYTVRTMVECEMQLADQNWTDTFTKVEVYQGDNALPTQVEKEASNLALDWRKRVVFAAELPASQMSRFDCRLEVIPSKPGLQIAGEDDDIRFQTDDLEVVINAKTGLIDKFSANGVNYLSEGTCKALVMNDDGDPWGMLTDRYRDQTGQFELLSPQDAAWLAGVEKDELPPVRIIEDGDVRTVVEALFGYNRSHICQRYMLPKNGTEIEVETRVLWNEKDKMLKLSIPTKVKESSYLGQVAFGVEDFPTDGTELVSQKWSAAVSGDGEQAVTCINDGIYGSDSCEGEIRLSLLRSPAYSAHPIGDRPLLPNDRFSARIDQGERVFRIWLNAGPAEERLEVIDREALAHNEKPMAVSFFPSGEGELLAEKPFAKLSDSTIQATAIKKAEDDETLILRLFEPTGSDRSTTVVVGDMEMKATLGGFEVKTLKVNLKKRQWSEVEMMEH